MHDELQQNIYELQQNTHEWHQMRKDKIGGSDAPVIMKVSPWKTPYRLWQEKTGIVEEADRTFVQEEGLRKEPIARQALEQELGVCLMPKVLFHPEFQWMMASLDGIDIEGKVIVEIKNPGRKDHEIAMSGTVPEKYVPQLQHQLEVAQCDSMIYYSFYDGEGVILKVNKDDRYIKNMIAQEQEFYKCMKDLKPPKMCDNDFVFINTLERQQLAQEWIKVNNDLRALEEEEQRLREALIATSPEQSSIGGGVKIHSYIKKGYINYDAVPELRKVNLDKFRSESSVCWRLSIA